MSPARLVDYAPLNYVRPEDIFGMPSTQSHKRKKSRRQRQHSNSEGSVDSDNIREFKQYETHGCDKSMSNSSRGTSYRTNGESSAQTTPDSQTVSSFDDEQCTTQNITFPDYRLLPRSAGGEPSYTQRDLVEAQATLFHRATASRPLQGSSFGSRVRNALRAAFELIEDGAEDLVGGYADGHGRAYRYQRRTNQGSHPEISWPVGVANLDSEPGQCQDGAGLHRSKRKEHRKASKKDVSRAKRKQKMPELNTAPENDTLAQARPQQPSSVVTQASFTAVVEPHGTIETLWPKPLTPRSKPAAQLSQNLHQNLSASGKLSAWNQDLISMQQSLPVLQPMQPEGLVCEVCGRKTLQHTQLCRTCIDLGYGNESLSGARLSQISLAPLPSAIRWSQFNLDTVSSSPDDQVLSVEMNDTFRGSTRNDLKHDEIRKFEPVTYTPSHPQVNRPDIRARSAWSSSFSSAFETSPSSPLLDNLQPSPLAKANAQTSTPSSTASLVPQNSESPPNSKRLFDGGDNPASGTYPTLHHRFAATPATERSSSCHTSLLTVETRGSQSLTPQFSFYTQNILPFVQFVQDSPSSMQNMPLALSYTTSDHQSHITNPADIHGQPSSGKHDLYYLPSTRYMPANVEAIANALGEPCETRKRSEVVLNLPTRCASLQADPVEPEISQQREPDSPSSVYSCTTQGRRRSAVSEYGAEQWRLLMGKD